MPGSIVAQSPSPALAGLVSANANATTRREERDPSILRDIPASGKTCLRRQMKRRSSISHPLRKLASSQEVLPIYLEILSMTFQCIPYVREVDGQEDLSKRLRE